MSGPIISSGGADDLHAIMPVMTSAFSRDFGEAWSESQCLGVISMPGAQLMIARNDAAREMGAIGFALSRVIVDECELMLLAVAAPSQRHGVGRALLNAIIGDARASSARAVFLEVRENNPAIALYSSAGFVATGRRRDYYRSPLGATFDALTFRLTLS